MDLPREGSVGGGGGGGGTEDNLSPTGVKQGVIANVEDDGEMLLSGGGGGGGGGGGWEGAGADKVDISEGTDKGDASEVTKLNKHKLN
jgi:hypothetical protein